MAEPKTASQAIWLTDSFVEFCVCFSWNHRSCSVELVFAFNGIHNICFDNNWICVWFVGSGFIYFPRYRLILMNFAKIQPQTEFLPTRPQTDTDFILLNCCWCCRDASRRNGARMLLERTGLWGLDQNCNRLVLIHNRHQNLQTFVEYVNNIFTVSKKRTRCHRTNTIERCFAIRR